MVQALLDWALSKHRLYIRDTKGVGPSPKSQSEAPLVKVKVEGIRP